MTINSLTFIMTDRCNEICSYCYQKKGTMNLSPQLAVNAHCNIEKYLSSPLEVVFYGGEPLLNYETIDILLGKINNSNEIQEVNYYLSTNGSLLTDRILENLNKNCFNLLMSCDGLAQSLQRPSISLDLITKTIVNILASYLNINLTVNCVITPPATDYLFDSIKYLIDLQVPKIRLSLVEDKEWNEGDIDKLEKQLSRLVDYLLLLAKKGKFPVQGYDQKPVKNNDLFSCGAYQNRLTIAPNGSIWGCHQFYFYSQNNPEIVTKYSAGSVENCPDNLSDLLNKKMDDICWLKQSMFHSEEKHCFQCERIYQCSICPVVAARSTGTIGKIPQWLCMLKDLEKSFLYTFKSKIMEEKDGN